MTKAALYGSLGLIGTLVVLLVTTVGQSVRAQARSDDPRIAVGKHLFADTCQNDHCHGGSARSVDDMVGLTAEHVRQVVTDGVAGVGMQGFKDVYTSEQLDALIAYVISAAGATNAPQPAHAVQLRGDAAAGRAIFSDSKAGQACVDCHAVNGSGGSVGPDLTHAGRRPSRDLFRAIVLRDGHPSARMPTDEFASRYSVKQLLDIVAFLRSTEAAAGDVTLKDVF